METHSFQGETDSLSLLKILLLSQQENKDLQGQVRTLSQEIQILTERLALLQSQRFSKKSEKEIYNPEAVQLHFFDPNEVEIPEEISEVHERVVMLGRAEGIYRSKDLAGKVNEWVNLSI